MNQSRETALIVHVAMVHGVGRRAAMELDDGYDISGLEGRFWIAYVYEDGIELVGLSGFHSHFIFTLLFLI